MVLAYVTVQFLVVAVIAEGLGWDLELSERIATRDALVLTLLDVVPITLFALLVAARWFDPLRVGVRAAAGSFGAGMRLLAPACLVVLGPSVLIGATADGPLLAAGMTPARATAFVLLASLIAISEELWFRGAVVDAAARSGGTWLPLVASALLFGAPHYAGDSATLLNAVAVSLAVGIPFTIVRMRVGSIWAGVVWHTAIDAWAFLHTGGVSPTGSPDPTEMLVALVLPGLVAAGYLTWFARQTPAERRTGLAAVDARPA